jgi:dTDP-4-dehydrorhamnose 3,5-epimerase
MKVKETEIAGLIIIEPSVFKDDRGYFYESYNKSQSDKHKIEANFVQDNQSLSQYGTIRGIHLQTGKSSQSKLVRVTSGEVLDVAVDLRPNSPTFGKYFSIRLSAENHLQLFIPKGFGHGFSVLSKEAILNYKCDNYYNPEAEDGIHPFDKSLNIDWQVTSEAVTLSTKDENQTTFNQFKAKYDSCNWW